ncbi:MAG: hypothetical protein JHD02_05355 [Thermoleophilaceae bacterium]|nr:hypothetical protein [Thermoleophilaceae bacterium]
MAGKQLEKQIAKALADTERWLRKQPTWAGGHLANAKGSVVSHRGPAVLSEADAVLQFARFLNKQGVAWRDMHIDVSPNQWLVEPTAGRSRPRRIQLAIVDRDRLVERTAPFSPARDKDFLFDAIFQFKLASSSWDRPRASGRKPKPPARIEAGIKADVKKMSSNLRDLWANRGYVVVIEETDYGWTRPGDASKDGLSVHYLQCF